MPGSEHLKYALNGILISFCYICLNGYLALTNKWLFSVRGFEYPLFIIIVGQTVTAIGCTVLIFGFKVSPMLSMEDLKKHWLILILNAALHGLATGLENISIEKTDISLNQVIKATTSLFTMLASYFVEHVTYSATLVSFNVLLVLGAIMTTIHNPNANMLGLVTSILSMLLGVIHVMLTGHLLQKIHIAPATLTLFTTLPAAITLIPGFISMELPLLYRSVFLHDEYQFELLVVAIGGFVAFAYTVVAMILIKITSAHYSAIVGNVKVAVLVIASLLFFPKKLSPINYLGMCLAFVSFFCYNYFKYQEEEKSKVFVHSDPETPETRENMHVEELDIKKQETNDSAANFL